MLYAVRYGQDWNDMALFSAEEKAKAKLVAQTVGYFKYHGTMYPRMVVYEGNGEAEYKHAGEYVVEEQSMKRMMDLFSTADLLKSPEVMFEFIVKA